MLAVPILACTMLFRQFYLQETGDLSVWKGGGMGMFASADDIRMRFARVYIIPKNGTRQPVVTFNDEQETLRLRVLNYPIDKNLLNLGEAVYQTVWASNANGVVRHRLLSDGTRADIKPFRYPVLKPSIQRQPDDQPDWQVLVEFWKLRYDNESRKISATHQKSVTYARP